MKSSLLNKLQVLVDRRLELAEELASPDAARDADRFKRLSQEYAQLGPVADAFTAHQVAVNDLAGLDEMANESDPEIRAMVSAERPSIEARISQLEQNLQQYLVPRDPLDGNNVFLEIRAGTGGDEAALFAGNLFNMYSRYAETQGWQGEVLSSSARWLQADRVAGDRFWRLLAVQVRKRRAPRAARARNRNPGAHSHLGGHRGGAAGGGG